MEKLFKLFCVLGISLIATSFAGCSDDDDEVVLSSEASIIKMTFDNPLVSGQPTIDGTDIKFRVPYGTTGDQLKELVPTIQISEKATVDPESGSKVDFSEGKVVFTVTAEDGTTKVKYDVTYKVDPNPEAMITSFTFVDQPIVITAPVIEGADITFSYDFGATDAQLRELVPTIEVSDQATVNPASGSKVDFTPGSVVFTVTAGDGSTSEYTVVAKRGLSPEAEMNSIEFSGNAVLSQPIIEGTNIHFYLSGEATDAELKEVIPTIKVSNFATVEPASGTKVDFTKENVEFVVTSEDKNHTTTYKVTWQKVIKYDMEKWKLENPSSGKDKYYYSPISKWSSSNTGAILLMALKHPVTKEPYVDRFVVTPSADKFVGDSAARIETLDSKGADMGFLGKIPKVTTGSLFLGSFEVKSDRLESTKFGINFTKKPLTLKGYYKYQPGPVFYECPDPTKMHEAVINTAKTDECSINAILYEISDDNDPYITGKNTLKDPRLVATAILQDGTAKSEYTPFSIDFKLNDGKTYDPAKKYRMSIICSSSKWGDTFSGAPESVLFVDDLMLIVE